LLLIRKNGLVIFLALLIFARVSPAFGQNQDQMASDPLRIGVGARILGMGKAYLGVSDDLNGMFIDPAALASLNQWELTSMTGKFINEFDYLNLGTAWPTPLGAFGLGYVDGSIGFASSGQNYSFNNRVYLLAWAGRPRTANWLNNFSFGTAYKYFSADLAGPNITDANARGNQLDLGLNFQPNTVFKFGLVLQNAVPAGAGGIIKWSNGTEEQLEETLKAGAGLKIVGPKGWRQAGDAELTLAVDHDFFPQEPGLPQLWHAGLEWSPVPPIDLRAGIDQDINGGGDVGQFTIANNFTAGVGLYLGGLRFDYAYHQYSDFLDADTQYFSISFGLDKEKKKPAAPPALFWIKPDDKSFLFTSEVSFTGKVLDAKIKHVALKGREVTLEANGGFSAVFPLPPLKSIFILQGYDRGYNLIDSKRIRLLNLRPVRDVPPDYWAAPAISVLLTEKVISGYPNGGFYPESKITRAEMCALLMKPYFLARGASEEARPHLHFSDVAPDYWAVPYIVRALKLGLIKGYPDGSFRPESTISRAEAVVIITRFSSLPEVKIPAPPYKDVPQRHYAAAAIAAAKGNGLLDFIVNDFFNPESDLKRSEAAYILFKAKLAEGSLHLKDEIKEFFEAAPQTTSEAAGLK
jgi:S-layer homology domain